jgi:hypothetical protein
LENDKVAFGFLFCISCSGAAGAEAGPLPGFKG